MKLDTMLCRPDDPELVARMASRGEAVREAGTAAIALAAMSVPMALAGMAKNVLAQGGLSQAVVEVLNLALTLEYREAESYSIGIETPGMIADRAVFRQIQRHEADHIRFLKSALGSPAANKPHFAFAAGGRVQPFHAYPPFLILAQQFEDTSVRGHKGQLGDLQPFDAYLPAVARNDSAGARHASDIRRIRRERGWLSFEDPHAPAALPAPRPGESSLMQLGIDVSSSEGTAAVTEAFDEPLSKDAVLAIAGQFIVVDERTPISGSVISHSHSRSALPHDSHH